MFKLKIYKNYFNSKNAEMLFTHENENYVVDLKFEKKKSLYDLLYAFSKKILNFIKLFIKKSCVESHLRIFQFRQNINIIYI